MFASMTTIFDDSTGFHSVLLFSEKTNNITFLKTNKKGKRNGWKVDLSVENGNAVTSDGNAACSGKGRTAGGQSTAKKNDKESVSTIYEIGRMQRKMPRSHSSPDSSSSEPSSSSSSPGEDSDGGA